MRRAFCPSSGFAGGFDRIANIFAIAQTDFAEQPAVFVANLHAVAGIRPYLLASDVKLHGAVDVDSWMRISIIPIFNWSRLHSGQAGCVFEPYWFEIFEQAFLAAFATVSAFAIAAESDGGVK